MRGTFGERTRELGEMVGEGTLRGSVEVDQVYALPIHSGFWRTGPLAGVTNRPRHGGQIGFLSRPLMEKHARYLAKLADGVLSGFLTQAMAENMEDLTQEVYERAPRLMDDLRRSGHPMVRDQGRVVYDRPPERARLTDAQLREKSKRVRLGEGHGARRPDIAF